MTDHLADARACIQSAARAPHPETIISWLTATCERIIAHLEAQQTPHRKEPPMTDPKLHALLDLAQFGDRLTLTHSNGKHTARISGPVLTETHDPAVGIHLLDGDPHVVRTSTGIVWAPVVQAALHRGGEVIAKWDTADHREAQQTSQQPATAPPAARQGDSGHSDGGEAVQAVMAVLCDMGADSGGWHSWRCFDRELYPEPCDCTKQAARAAIAAAEPHIRAEVREHVASELIPVVAHKGPNDTDLSLLDEAAHRVEHGYSLDSNITTAVVRLIRNAIHIARKEQP